MRGVSISLAAIRNRVERLAERVRPSPEDWAARLRTMSDQELNGVMADLVEKAGGAAACFAQTGLDCEKYPEVQRILRERQAISQAT